MMQNNLLRVKCEFILIVEVLAIYLLHSWRAVHRCLHHILTHQLVILSCLSLVHTNITVTNQLTLIVHTKQTSRYRVKLQIALLHFRLVHDDYAAVLLEIGCR